jgi:hypothetical protein
VNLLVEPESKGCGYLPTALGHCVTESWNLSDLDFENNSDTTRSTKTKKNMETQLVSVPIVAQLKKCVSGLPA